MKYALYQMNVHVANPEKNREKIASWIEKQMMETKPDTIVLPEMWNTGYALDQLEPIADQNGKATIPFLSNLAKEFSVNIVGGSVANKKEDGIYNSSFVLNREGEVIHRYDKIHLVPMLDEPKYLEGGRNKAGHFELDGVKMGVVICYDLRFPELLRPLALNGAKVIHIVAQWPSARIEHWKYLLHARAIENQCYIIAVNSSGSCKETQFAGESLVIDPAGKLVTSGPSEKEASLHVTLQLEKVTETRKSIPIFTSRVPHLYESVKGDFHA